MWYGLLLFTDAWFLAFLVYVFFKSSPGLNTRARIALVAYAALILLNAATLLALVTGVTFE